MHRSPTILLVEPDPDTRLLYRLSLQELNADIAEASDGAQALALAVSRAPDLVISELRMPRIDGLSLCSLLRSDSQTTRAAFLIVTGNGTPEVVQMAQARGANAVLLKPCAPATLASTVTTLLQQTETGAASLAEPSSPESSPRPRAMSRACVRGSTNTPPTPPPPLHCPRCDAVLQYLHTQLGGVNDRFAERWDYFSCAACGTFQYRHRTRKLKPVEERSA